MSCTRPRALRFFMAALFGVAVIFPMPNYSQPESIFFASLVPNDEKSISRKVGAGVIEALRSDGFATIMIALHDPTNTEVEYYDLSRLQLTVAEAQESVLSSLNASDFLTTNRYRAIPAISGKLFTEFGLAKLSANSYVKRIDLDVGGAGSLGMSVPLIGAGTWHNVGILGQGIVVAVLDSGADTDHSDLAPAIIDQACFLDADGSINGIGYCPNGSDRQYGPGSAEDDAGHGTHVTGIIASRGNRSSPGVAPGVSIVSIKVTTGPTFAGTFFYFSEVVAGLDYILTERPDVQIVNMSLVTNAQFVGNCDNTTAWNMAGAAAINTLRSRGVIAFASSGNRGGSLMSSPACLSSVVSVGASNNNDTVASFTDSNSTTDLMAPGVGIAAPGMGDSTVQASGTSMASPHAAGCAALLIASREAVTPDQIETRLKASTPRVYNPRNGLTYPRIECSVKPLASVLLSGPTAGTVDLPYQYLAVTNPITATQPISYFWVPPPLRGQSTSAATYEWTTPGSYPITVTATNAASTPVSDVLTVTISAAPTNWYRTFLPWVSR